MNNEAVRAFMKAYSMNSTALAEYVGTTPQLLNNRLNPASRNRLNHDDMIAILSFFTQLSDDLQQFIATGMETLPERLK